jgi:hypothetical protein
MNRFSVLVFFHLCFNFPIPNTDRSAYHEEPDE